jgi:hypothetical protein
VLKTAGSKLLALQVTVIRKISLILVIVLAATVDVVAFLDSLGLEFPMKFSSGLAVLVTVIAVVVCAALAACGSGQTGAYAACRQTVIATDAGVTTGGTLLAGASISKGDALVILDVARPAYEAEKAWKLAIDSGNTDAITTAAAAVQPTLAKLLEELQALQQKKNLKVNPAAGRARLSIASIREHVAPPQEASPAGADPSKKKIDLVAAVTIIQLVADLTPKIVDWINAASARGVTAADVQASLDTLGRDIATLEAATN